jgi:hypothetical protein
LPGGSRGLGDVYKRQLFMPLIDVFRAALIPHFALLHPPTEWGIARIQLHSTTALSR